MLCREYNDPDIEITPAGFPDPNARRKTLEASLPVPMAPTQLPDAYRVAIDQAHTRLRNQPAPELDEGVTIPGGMAQEHSDRVRTAEPAHKQLPQPHLKSYSLLPATCCNLMAVLEAEEQGAVMLMFQALLPHHSGCPAHMCRPCSSQFIRRRQHPRAVSQRHLSFWQSIPARKRARCTGMRLLPVSHGLVSIKPLKLVMQYPVHL